MPKRLNLALERLKAPFIRRHLHRVLIIENTNLIGQSLDSLLDLGQIGLSRSGSTLFP
jgi:hypothetical protein